jgi:FKBP-type peptidyl-prolyl cis-trans isomerase
MKRALGLSLLFFSLACFAAVNDSTINYSLPDSVKVISFMTEFTIRNMSKSKYAEAGIMTDAVVLSLKKIPIGASINFQAINNYMQKPVAKGLNVRDPDQKTESLDFSYDWKVGETYRLLIAQASDSAGNFSLYSGYVFLPNENKWKLIGTFKIQGRWNSIQRPTVFYGGRKKQTISVAVNQVWCQRQNGSWKNMSQTNFTPPVVNLYSHVDSLKQLEIEKKELDKLKSSSLGSTYKESGGVYYAIIKEGDGKLVSVNDTVVAFYKGHLFSDNSMFDQTKETPATFPLNRLIKGWQIGVPLCKVGGKIQIIIPSNLGYSIRTRAAKIPPNSILVFEIEVVDAKSPQ